MKFNPRSLFFFVTIIFIAKLFPPNLLLGQTVIDASTILTNAVYVVGESSSGNTLLITNGGDLFVTNGVTIPSGPNTSGLIGSNSGSALNHVTVTGSGSQWTNANSLIIGWRGYSNSLTISAGGLVYNGLALIGGQASASNNSVFVTGNNSLWTNQIDLNVGFGGRNNSLTISSGGRVVNNNGYVGFLASSSNNAIIVSGAESVWSNRNNFFLGFAGQSNSLIISNSGVVYAGNLMVIGSSSSTNNHLQIFGSGSRVVVTNGSAVLDVRQGTLTLDNGEVLAGNIFATNSLSIIQGHGKMTGVTTISNGGTFDVSGNMTNVGNVNFGSSANITTLDDHTDIFRIEGGIFSNSVNFSLAAGNSGDFSLDLNGSSSFAQNGGVITWTFSTPPANGHYGGVRSVNNIFSAYQNSSGFFTNAFYASGLSSEQYLKTYFDGSFYYLVIIPEPSTCAMLGLGAIGVFVAIIRHKKPFISSPR